MNLFDICDFTTPLEIQVNENNYPVGVSTDDLVPPPRPNILIAQDPPIVVSDPVRFTPEFSDRLLTLNRTSKEITLIDANTNIEEFLGNGNKSADLIQAKIPLRTGNRPVDFAVTSNNSRIYVVLENSGELLELDAVTFNTLNTITLSADARPRAIALHPNGRYAYVADSSQDLIYVVSTDTSSEFYNRVVGTISASSSGKIGLRQMSINSDGTKLILTQSSDFYAEESISRILEININEKDEPTGYPEVTRNQNKFHQITKVIDAPEPRIFEVSPTSDPDKMAVTFARTEKGNGFYGVYSINKGKIENIIPLNIGNADSLYIRDPRNVAVHTTESGESYAFIVGYGGSPYPGVTDPLSFNIAASGNMGIIINALDRPELRAATITFPAGFPTSVNINGNYLYLTFSNVEIKDKGRGLTVVYNLEKIIEIVKNPANQTRLANEPIDLAFPDSVVAGGFKKQGSATVADPFKEPIPNIGNPANGFIEKPVDFVKELKQETTLITEPTPPPGNNRQKILEIIAKLGLTATAGYLTWEYLKDKTKLKEVSLYISTFPQGEGLFPGEDKFVNRPLPQGLKEDDIRKDIGGNRYDYNPNRVLTATMELPKVATDAIRWIVKIGGKQVRTINLEDVDNIFPLLDELNLTAGQKYYWGLEVKDKSDKVDRDTGSFYVPLATNNSAASTPASPGDPFTSVTFLTHDGKSFAPNSLAMIQKIALSLERKRNEQNLEGTILQYRPDTGEWKVISGDLQPGKPLILIADWMQDSEKINSGFAEAAADSLFASLVQLDLQLNGSVGGYDAQGNLIRERGSLFKSPFHFIGIGRGAVVNSEIVQRLGTLFPNVWGINSGQLDLQMSAIDPPDLAEPSLNPRNNNYFEPKTQIWENVSFADTYYQTITNPLRRGQDLEKIVKDNINVINNADLSVRLDGRAGFNKPASGGFAPETNRNPHERSLMWYGGTTDLSWGTRQTKSTLKQLNYQVHRRKADFSYKELYDYDSSSNLQPWYTPNHSSKIIDQPLPPLEQWEGVGTGWYYSLLGGGSDKRNKLPLPIDNSRTPVSKDNTSERRMQGDFAVPTLFNGNFDAINDTFNFQTIPGWSLHNGDDKNLRQDTLVDWSAIPTFNIPREIYRYPNAGQNAGQIIQRTYLQQMGYNPNQPNYALRLSSDQSITHNRFIVPDWGTLRFNLHVPEDQLGGQLTVSIQGDIPGYDTYQVLETIDLRVADGRINPGDINEIQYQTGYAETDTYRIGFGTQGFETFHIDIPQSFRGKTATIKFEVAGSTVYVDDVFFKSSHLILGNPDEARLDRNDPANNLTNLLIEKPQYSLSYNNELRTPNWVSWQLNQSWIGNVPRPGTTDGYIPPIAGINRAIYPWRADNMLPTGFNAAQPWDYLGGAQINPPITNPNFVWSERGHQAAVDDRDRHLKDIFATFFTTNAVAQHRGVNRGVWAAFEEDLQKYVAEQGREIYIISGGYGFNNTLTSSNGIDRLIRIPDRLWKIAVILNPGQKISDITTSTPIITIDISNNQRAVGTPWTQHIISLIELENRIRNSRNQYGGSHNYDFLSNVPEGIKNQLKRDPYIPGTLRGLLLAESEIDLNTEIDNISPTIDQSSTTQIDSIVFGLSENIGVFNRSLSEDSTRQINSLEITPHNSRITQISPTQISKSSIDNHGFTQIGFNKGSSYQNSFMKIGFPQIDITEISTIKHCSKEISLSQVSSTQVGPNHFNLTQISSTQVSVSKDSSLQTSLTQVNSIQVNSTQINSIGFKPSEISTSSSISTDHLFSKQLQLLGIHNSTPSSINTVNNSALNLWNTILKPQTTFDINLEITNLPTGQLAEAQITQFDNQGIPIGGTLRIDDDANGVGWFIDPTPLDNSEFEYTLSETAYRAAPDSPAYGRYDLYTTILHEMGHLFGFLKGVGGYDRYLQTPNGRSSLVGPDFNVPLSGDLSHLDPSEYPNDLMNPFLRTNLRKLPTQLDIQILNAVRSTQLEKQWSVANQNNASLLAPLTAPPLIPIVNGDFEIEEKTNPEYGWSERGSTNIEQGYAVLREDSPFLSNLSQTFLIPEGSKTLQFTIKDTQLGTSKNLPNDAVEVALLDPTTLTPLAGTSTGLSNTDSLLNLQANGTAYSSNFVNFTGSNTSNLNYRTPQTVQIDISHLAPGTLATLHFDLIGFGAADSNVKIDNVLINNNFTPPVAFADTATTIQKQPIQIGEVGEDRGVSSTNTSSTPYLAYGKGGLQEAPTPQPHPIITF